MRIWIFLFLAFPPFAKADVIRCTFKQFSTEYSMVRQSFALTITAHGPSHGVSYKEEKVSFQILGSGHFALWSQSKELIQRMVLNSKGSDGLSRKVYPYSAEYIHPQGGQSEMGGCISNYLKEDQKPQPRAPRPAPPKPRPDPQPSPPEEPVDNLPDDRSNGEPGQVEDIEP